MRHTFAIVLAAFAAVVTRAAIAESPHAALERENASAVAYESAFMEAQRQPLAIGMLDSEEGDQGWKIVVFRRLPQFPPDPHPNMSPEELVSWRAENARWTWIAILRTHDVELRREVAEAACPQVRATLADLERVPMPRMDLPGIRRSIRQSASSTTDGAQYRLWTKHALFDQPSSHGTILVEGGEESPVGNAIARAFTTLDVCWTTVRPR